MGGNKKVGASVSLEAHTHVRPPTATRAGGPGRAPRPAHRDPARGPPVLEEVGGGVIDKEADDDDSISNPILANIC